MPLCPDNHENPKVLSHCAVCGLPLIDPPHEFELLSNRLRMRAILARPKPLNILVGVGSIGRKIVVGLRTMGIGHEIPRLSSLAVDTSATEGPPAQETGPLLSLRLGRDVSGGSTFCGHGERVATQEPSLSPWLKNAGLREQDEGQAVFAVAALGGGTGSGVTPIVLQKVRALNQACYIFVLAILPAAEEPLHAHINAFYGLSRLLRSGGEPLVHAVIVAQYERLKRLRGVGQAGEELKMDSLVLALYRLMVLTLAIPNASRIGRLNRWMQTQVLVPCLALGRSIEIFGSLSNVLESAIAYPLASVSKKDVIVSHLLLRIPQRLARAFPESLVGEELASLNRRHLPNVRSSLFQTCQTEDQSDRIDACLLLGGDRVATTLSAGKADYDELSSWLKKPRQQEAYGLTQDKIRAAEETLALYDSRLEELRA